MALEGEEATEAFNLWLNSIEFIDEDGEIVPHKLTKDESDDPEGDRGE